MPLLRSLTRAQRHVLAQMLRDASLAPPAQKVYQKLTQIYKTNIIKRDQLAGGGRQRQSCASAAAARRRQPAAEGKKRVSKGG